MRENRGPFCEADACGRRAFRQVREIPLCLAHFRRLEWHLQLLNMTVVQFDGSITDLVAVSESMYPSGAHDFNSDPSPTVQKEPFALCACSINAI